MIHRLKEGWFEFNGVNSREYGIMLRQMPTRSLPGRNYTRKKVSGRNGTVLTGDGSYTDVTVKLEFDAPDPSMIPSINAWLTGSGLLRFSDEPSLAYEAYIDKEYNRASPVPRFATQRYSVTFVCHPFRLHWPVDGNAVQITESGTVLENPGTAPSSPRVSITGTGDFALTIGMETMFFNDVDGGIIVDTELMDAFTADGTLLANDRVSGPFFHIAPGMNVVSWLAEDGSSVSGVSILPRWRSM